MVPAPPLPAVPRLTLVLGGARSGKSRHAEALITATAPPWIYVATAQPFDEEMIERIAQHKARRAEGWQTLETTHDLAGLLRERADSTTPVLIDCLTLWLSNVMLADMNVPAACAELINALATSRGPIIAVSNEVGLGIVPDNALARAFRDAQGRLNQEVAALADRVILMAAGLPLTLK